MKEKNSYNMKKNDVDQIDNFPALLVFLKIILLNSYKKGDDKKMSSARHHTCGYLCIPLQVMLTVSEANSDRQNDSL